MNTTPAIYPSAGVLVNRMFVAMQNQFSLTVPEDFRHGHFLDGFAIKHRSEFKHYCNGIADSAFLSVSTKLQPGQKILVTFFRQKHMEMVTSFEDRLAFLHQQDGSVFLGPYGLALIYRLRRDQIFLPGWYMSLDNRQSLPRDINGQDIMFPVLGMHLSGIHPDPGEVYDFDLWGENEAYDFGDFIVCFKLHKK